jgi:hypothetical protein
MFRALILYCFEKKISCLKLLNNFSNQSLIKNMLYKTLIIRFLTINSVTWEVRAKGLNYHLG